MFDWLSSLFTAGNGAETEPNRIDRYRELQARHPSEGLTVSLETRDGRLPLTLTATNPTDGVLQFCVYHTPFEGIANEWLEVRGEDGEARPYRGVMMSRLAPGPEHFIVMPPGDSRSAEFDPSEAYELGPGVWTVTFKGGGGLPASESVTLTIA